MGPTPRTSDGDLKQALDFVARTGALAFDLGPYARMDKSNGVSACGLHHMLPILRMLLPLQATARFLHAQMRECLLGVVQKHNHIKFNETCYSNKVWSEFVTKKLLVACSHWRDIVSHRDSWDRAMRVCANEKQVRDLEELRARYPIVAPSAGSSIAASSLVEPKQKARKLMQKNSVCSSVPSLAESSGCSSASAGDETDEDALSICSSDSIGREAKGVATVPLPHGRGVLKKMLVKNQWHDARLHSLPS